MIPSLILLVFDDSDLGSLAAAAAAIKTMQVENLWVLHNPQLGLPNPPQAEELVRRITEAQAAERQAGARRDYTSASQYRDLANGLEVELGLAIKGAYKLLAADELQKAYSEAFAAISQESTGAKNILVEVIPDPLNKSQAFQFLNMQSASNWVDQFPHGEYIVAWAGALGFHKAVVPMPKGAISRTPEPKAPVAKPVEPKVEPKQDAGLLGGVPDPEGMSWNELRAYARQKEIKGFEKMNKVEILNALKLLSL